MDRLEGELSYVAVCSGYRASASEKHPSSNFHTMLKQIVFQS